MAVLEMTRAPERSHEQRTDALKTANRVRVFRARKKRELKARVADPRSIVLEPPAEMLSMKLFDFLIALPGVGRVRANRMLRAADCSPSRTLGGATGRQRGALAAVLDSRSSFGGLRDR
jgi:hypothetical protein